MKHLLFLTTVLLATVAYCASSDAEREAIFRAADKVLAHGKYAVFIVPASAGPANDSVLSGLSAIGGPSRLVKQAVKTILACRSQKLDLAIAGKTEAKCRATMLAALNYLKKEKIDGMRIYYMLAPDPDLKSATEALGGSALFTEPNKASEPTAIIPPPSATRVARFSNF